MELIYIGTLDDVKLYGTDRIEKISEIDRAYSIKTTTEKIITSYKLLQGVKQDDRKWDKLYYSRFVRAAKQLETVFDGNWEIIKKCLIEISDGFTKSNLSWTLDTVVKHAYNWKLKREKGDANDGRK
jgi:hypothetical protein